MIATYVVERHSEKVAACNYYYEIFHITFNLVVYIVPLQILASGNIYNQFSIENALFCLYITP